MSKAIVAIQVGDEVEYHAHGGSAGGYDTLCGMDASDPRIGHHGIVPTPRGAKIDCRSCYQIWNESRKVRRSHFTQGVTK